ncbi:hypothetical protein AB0I27_03505 [Streptomyces sp. NPDC050597]|uniref:hypothetical protein n=1 Tax=Streptomyces sp. NPDC050597 TaxID=3157212 RepID=UPI003413199B
MDSGGAALVGAVAALLGAVVGAGQECEEACAQLELEATSQVSAAAVHALAVLDHWAWRSREYWDPDQSELVTTTSGISRRDMFQMPDFPRDYVEQIEFAGEAIASFMNQARKDLDMPR